MIWRGMIGVSLRLPFFDWLSRRNFSWSSHYSKNPSGDWMVFPAGGATTIDTLSKLIRGITITLTLRWLAALSPCIMLRNSLLTKGKMRHISVLWIWGLTKIMFQFLNTTVINVMWGLGEQAKRPSWGRCMRGYPSHGRHLKLEY